MGDNTARPRIELRNIREVAALNFAEEALQNDGKNLASTLDSIGDCVISTDRKSRILRMNRVAQLLTGWPLIEAKGRHLNEVFKIIDGVTGAKLTSPFDAAMCSGLPISLAPNTALVARNGKQYLIENSAAPIQDHKSQSPSGVVLVFRDVTEKRKLEIEFQQARKLETIGRLAGGVAHEFNNILAGIMGYSEVLRQELRRNPRLEGYALAILETSERAAKLTKQLLAFSRMGKMATLPVDINARIAAAVSLLERTIERRVSIVTRFNAALPTIMGDPTLLESAILNLGLNACDATASGGVISIETNNVRLTHDSITSTSSSIEPGNYVEVVISDTGMGMTEDVKEHLYEPFYSTKEVGRGTGLALAAVYGTVKEHHGAITVKSQLNQGTCFKIFLPLAEHSALEVKEASVPVFAGSGCILLVDDERIVREPTAEMLRAIGYDVLLAESGVEALEIYKIEKERIQLIILDLTMPQMNGPDTFFALRNINQDVKIIFSSGYSFDRGGKELLSAGAFGFLQKPFSRSALYRVIEENLKNDQVSEEPVNI